MAFFDWNHNGKNDIQDDYLEYKIYKECTKNNNNYTPSNNDGVSTFGAILATIGGLVMEAIILSPFDIDNIPGLILALLWIICSAVLGVWFDHIGL